MRAFRFPVPLPQTVLISDSVSHPDWNIF